MATLEDRKTTHQESQGAYPGDSELASFSQNISTLEGALKKLNVEVMAPAPDLNRAGIFLSEMISIKAELQSQQIRALQLTGMDDANIVRLQLALHESEEIAKRFDKFAGEGERRLAALQEEYEAKMREFDDAEKRNANAQPLLGTVDNAAIPADHATMTDVTREEMNARLETIETRMDGRLSSIEHMIGTKFAEFDATLHKTNADMIKWVAGTVIAVGAAGLALMTFLINNITPKSSAAPAPIIITVPSTSAPTAAPPAGLVPFTGQLDKSKR